MARRRYIVENQQFKTEEEYRMALQDQKLMERMRSVCEGYSDGQKKTLIARIRSGEFPFKTRLGLLFAEELESSLVKGKPVKPSEDKIDRMAREMIRKKEKNRKRLILALSLVGMVCIAWFGVYSYFDYRTGKQMEQLSQLKGQISEPWEKPDSDTQQEPLYQLDTPAEEREVLEEYKKLYNKNKKLIGWLKIDDTNIDYPVMQTVDNTYYLDHNSNQEYDKNGSIFMDKDCDVLKPSTNFIIYGHHMASGRMFGRLGKYQDKEYYEEHKYIQFDTIYEKGLYQVMYVFRSRVYSNEDIVFKYYQFIDAGSEEEFQSYMQEMEKEALYDTGVRAEYGDQLLTLTTCDYHEKNGRFVVIAKKVTAKE